MDNTLYQQTPEYADLLDEVMAEALVEDLGVKMSVDEAKVIVKESFKIYRDGGQIFYDEYGIDPIKLFYAYHKRRPDEKVVPIEGLKERLTQLPIEQYIFTYATQEAANRALKQIGLDDFFEGRLHTVEEYNFSKKNDNAEVYLQLSKNIGFDPKDCIFVDDSYSNLEFAKEAGMTTVRIFYNQNSAKDKEYIDAAYKGVNSFLDDLIPQLKSC